MKHLTVPLLACVLVACGDSGTSTAPPPPTPEPTTPASASFEVTVVNLSNAQPLSPIAVLAHGADQRLFTVGQAASQGLEMLAESGDNSELLAEIDARATISGEAPLGPGATTTLTLELDSDDTNATLLSLASMLVNTNDAITALNGIDVSGLAVGDTLAFSTVAYDSGTEANDEAAGTIPGPADGGEGFNADRNDVADQVTMHGGVVTVDDGLNTSVLNQTHRFDNPVARVMIRRTQ
ncbi:spondin domain-containing protein [Congregibacter variabilis]|uniref:Spondin domain-containing protein n=1 Tax=Congregibacter variabilis TaxID=3081200 RepID=A0ABZ0I5I7_9GAMM|nr:spondin domain-containing protein [Congregibacter sp. IMCC43200]